MIWVVGYVIIDFKELRDMGTLPTKVVILHDGTRIVINASDFNPSLHRDEPKNKPVPKRKPSGRYNS